MSTSKITAATPAAEIAAAADALRRAGSAAIGRYAPYPACRYAGAGRLSLARWLDGHTESETRQPDTAGAHALAVARAVLTAIAP